MSGQYLKRCHLSASVRHHCQLHAVCTACFLWLHEIEADRSPAQNCGWAGSSTKPKTATPLPALTFTNAPESSVVGEKRPASRIASRTSPPAPLPNPRTAVPSLSLSHITDPRPRGIPKPRSSAEFREKEEGTCSHFRDVAQPSLRQPSTFCPVQKQQHLAAPFFLDSLFALPRSLRGR